MWTHRFKSRHLSASRNHPPYTTLLVHEFSEKKGKASVVKIRSQKEHKEQERKTAWAHRKTFDKLKDGLLVLPLQFT